MTPLERLKAQQAAFAGVHKDIAAHQARQRAASIGNAEIVQRAMSRARPAPTKPKGVEVPRVVEPIAKDADEGPKPAA